jgi:hypothetical protein
VGRVERQPIGAPYGSCSPGPRHAGRLPSVPEDVAGPEGDLGEGTATATLHVVDRSYGDVRPTSEVLDLVEAGRRQVTSS